jgi:hypothetical protein
MSRKSAARRSGSRCRRSRRPRRPLQGTSGADSSPQRGLAVSLRGRRSRRSSIWPVVPAGSAIILRSFFTAPCSPPWPTPVSPRCPRLFVFPPAGPAATPGEWSAGGAHRHRRVLALRRPYSRSSEGERRQLAACSKNDRSTAAAAICCSSRHASGPSRRGRRKRPTSPTTAACRRSSASSAASPTARRRPPQAPADPGRPRRPAP